MEPCLPLWEPNKADMAAAEKSLFPLESVSNKDLANLCEALWAWRPCGEWVSGTECRTVGCPCQRAIKLQPFFDYYKNITAYYLPDHVGQAHPALGCHNHLIAIIKMLRTNLDEERSKVTTEYFDGRASRESGPSPPQSDQDRAFNIAARIMAMTRPSAQNQSDGLLESGAQTIIWYRGNSLASFVNSAFPKRDHPALSRNDETSSSDEVRLASITANRAKKAAKLKIIATDDLRDHLLLDEKKGTVSVFHLTSVLKEHLNTPNRMYVLQFIARFLFFLSVIR